ncbi:unnamed protein product [Rangifer tarandus platyrhynchus]|uniref:Uncharacterized protein n=1 Tax=Rangifer tarandus platyrhynchus TaxID=3082113 RepID=A0AC59YPF3_RANTA
MMEADGRDRCRSGGRMKDDPESGGGSPPSLSGAMHIFRINSIQNAFRPNLNPPTFQSFRLISVLHPICTRFSDT